MLSTMETNDNYYYMLYELFEKSIWATRSSGEVE